MSEAPAVETAQPAPPRPSPEQIQRTLDWVGEVFRAHYRAHPPPMPARHGKREFGFIPAPRPPPDRTPFFRHMAMRSREELRDYLVRQAPWHCYYSTAYYAKPDAPTMKEKEWLGADLIFDLDADHLQGAEGMTFEQQLDAVKKQARRLVEGFLLTDFGFDPADVRLVFSGGRGYHVHVTDPRVLKLGASERREIVDYIVPPEDLLGEILDGTERRHAYVKNDFTRKGEQEILLPPANAPGWGGRYTRFIADFLEDAMQAPREEGVKKLSALKGIGPKGAGEILDDLGVADSTGVDRLARLREGRIQAAPAVRKHLKALRAAMREQAIRFAPGETDEPVTADIKRLIRMPGSLHGKTGLCVTPLPIDRLADFDPLVEAVALPDTPVKVVVSKPEPVRLAGERVEPKPGLNELPLRHAMFLVLRRRALIA